MRVERETVGMRSTLTITVLTEDSDAIVSAVEEQVSGDVEVDTSPNGDENMVRFEVSTAAYADARPNTELVSVLESFDASVWEDASFFIDRAEVSEPVEGALWNGPRSVEWVEGGSIPS